MHKCGVGEGDCNFDKDCEGDLKCGTRNCDDDFPLTNFGEKFDCCYNPGKCIFNFCTVFASKVYLHVIGKLLFSFRA